MMGRTGQSVMLNGEGFGTQQGNVKVGSVYVNVISWTDNEIRIELPTVNPGKHDIKVITAAEKESNAYPDFEVLSGKQVSVRFIVNDAYTSLGENIYLVGSIYELGNWDTSKAVGPLYNQVIKSYPSWYYDMNVPENETVEFKFIKKDSNGNVIWESGANHQMLTPLDLPGTFETKWQN